MIPSRAVHDDGIFLKPKDGAAMKKLVFVEGMSCGHCTMKVQSNLGDSLEWQRLRSIYLGRPRWWKEREKE